MNREAGAEDVLEPFGGVERVAVVGAAGRFPRARTLAEYWENLLRGEIAITRFGRDELERAGEDPRRLDDPEYVAARAVLEDVDLFDARLFGLSPREARILDPQVRVLLECAWEALESAGYDSRRFDGPVGVFAGMGMTTYYWQNLLGGHFEGPLDDVEARVANDKDFLTTWISYKLDLTGPSIAVQTACSTSLVAVHAACQSLLTHESDMALAGGVTILLPQVHGYVAKEGGTGSRDGRCLPFDARATGLVGGSGAGLVVLRRLSDALEAGDPVLGVILGSAVNNEGSNKVGYTAPSVEGQVRVIREALDLAGVDPETIDYVEAHGTGTTIGDPIEVEALTRAFGSRRRGFCGLGSVKANIGHLDAAAGVASLIKVLLALRHGVIPPSSYFETPNPLVDFASSPFFVNSEPLEWRADGRPRRAGVSSFGMGGTNAHLVVESPPSSPPSAPPGRDKYLVTVSAEDARAREEAAANLASYLESHSEVEPADVAFTTNLGRQELSYRRAVVCDTREGLTERLRTTPPAAERTLHARPALVFLFPGQGEQRVAMAADLYEQEPVFRAELDRCLELLDPQLGFRLRELLLSGAAAGDQDELDRTELAQPALFVFEYALARQWAHWGVRPDSMLGHSVGEYIAACLAGVFSLEDALGVVTARGRLMQALPAGAMVAVAASEADVAELVRDGVDLAAVNAPRQCVLSGSSEAISALEEELSARGMRFRRLKTSHAFHSAQIEPILDDFRTVLDGATLRPPTLPFFSNLSGELIAADDAVDPGYWVRHVRAPVRFLASLEVLAAEAPLVCLEVGPGTTLRSLTRMALGGDDQVVVASVPGGAGPAPAGEQLLEACGALWELGLPIDWGAFYPERRQRLPLPPYPFQHERFWVDAPVGPAAVATTPAAAGAEPEATSGGEPEEPTAADSVTVVAEVFRQAFGLESVGPDDDFFQLGGNSLVAADVMHRLRRTFATDVPVRLLFDAPKVADLAAHIEAERRSDADVDAIVAELERLEASEVEALLSESALQGEGVEQR
jgi:acyl transferase domain-containing protein